MSALGPSGQFVATQHFGRFGAKRIYLSLSQNGFLSTRTNTSQLRDVLPDDRKLKGRGGVQSHISALAIGAIAAKKGARFKEIQEIRSEIHAPRLRMSMLKLRAVAVSHSRTSVSASGRYEQWSAK